MTPEKKQVVNKILANLDDTAQRIDNLVKEGKLDPKVASSITREIDAFADKFEVAAYGVESFKKRQAQLRQAKVIERDPDEKYMETFQNPVKPIETEPDEPYMHKAEHGYNSTKDMGTYDVDRSSTVVDRDEYEVRELSEWSDKTKKQPSWVKGPAGKSTAIGSARKASSKTWAP